MLIIGTKMKRRCIQMEKKKAVFWIVGIIVVILLIASGIVWRVWQTFSPTTPTSEEKTSSADQTEIEADNPDEINQSIQQTGESAEEEAPEISESTLEFSAENPLIVEGIPDRSGANAAKNTSGNALVIQYTTDDGIHHLVYQMKETEEAAAKSAEHYFESWNLEEDANAIDAGVVYLQAKADPSYSLAIPLAKIGTGVLYVAQVSETEQIEFEAYNSSYSQETWDRYDAYRHGRID